MSTSPDPFLAEHPSPVSFDATVARLSDAIAAAGLTVFATIDHAANARAVGMATPPAAMLRGRARVAGRQRPRDAADAAAGLAGAAASALSSATAPSYSWKFGGHSLTTCLNNADASPRWRSSASSPM